MYTVFIYLFIVVKIKHIYMWSLWCPFLLLYSLIAPDIIYFVSGVLIVDYTRGIRRLAYNSILYLIYGWLGLGWGTVHSNKSLKIVTIRTFGIREIF